LDKYYNVLESYSWLNYVNIWEVLVQWWTGPPGHREKSRWAGPPEWAIFWPPGPPVH